MSEEVVDVFGGGVDIPSPGGGGDFKVPDAGAQPAVLVALIDLGTHEREFQGKKLSDARRIYLVWELTEEASCLVGRDFVLSGNEKSGLRKLTEKVLNKKYAVGEKMRPIDLLGRSCIVTIEHSKSADGEKTYANFKDATSPMKGMTIAKPKNKPFCWQVGKDKLDDPRLVELPRIFGEKVVDFIKRCNELRGSRHSSLPASDTNGDAIDPVNDIPF